MKKLARGQKLKTPGVIAGAYQGQSPTDPGQPKFSKGRSRAKALRNKSAY